MPDEAVSKPRIYLSAFLCQEVLREKNSDVLTAIRISNAYTILATEVTVELGPGLSVSKQVYLPVQFSAVLSFYSDGPVDFDVNLKGFDPDGLELELGEPYRCHSEGGASGHTLNNRITIPTSKPGEHRIDVYVDNVKVTTMPLRIIHARRLIPDPQQGQPPAPSGAASD